MSAWRFRLRAAASRSFRRRRLRRLKVDFLAVILAHVADPQIAGDAIEAVAKRIAQTVRPNFIITDVVAGMPTPALNGLVGGIA